jgi:hypothetical protein
MHIMFFRANEEFSSSDAVIQYQDPTGNWLDTERVPNQTLLIGLGMRRVSEYFNGSKRVRAVDESGRVLDIL